MAIRFFAVGLGKWVQIRKARVPPKAHTSTSTRTVTRRRWQLGRLDVDTGRFTPGKFVSVPVKLTMKQTIYEGGRTVSTLPQREVARKIKIGVRDGGLVELLPEQAEKLLETDG